MEQAGSQFIQNVKIIIPQLSQSALSSNEEITSTFFRTFAAAPSSGYRGLRVQDLYGDHAVEPAHVHVSPGSPFLPGDISQARDD